ncbi:MAG: gas vesicle protein GvpG [Pseudomonadota bacterium]
MGLLRRALLLPVAGPIQGALWVADKVAEAADEELNSPASIKRQLQLLEDALLAGDLSEEAYDEAETDLLLRLKARS